MKQKGPMSLVIFILSTTYLYAQNDSIIVTSAKWNTQKIGSGLIWKYYHFKGDLFASKQMVNILEIRKPGRYLFEIGFEEKELKPASEFGKEANAIAALNGTFFDMKNGGSVDFIRSDGEIIQANKMPGNVREFHQKAAVAMRKGALRIEKWNGDTDWEYKLEGEDIMLSGPLLIFEDHAESLDSSTFNVVRHPRTVVAITGKRVLLVTVDGRDENAAGMSLFELRDFLRWLDVNDAINLDGGGSTTLWIHNQPEGGVVNYPCDNKKWDHAGERNVANVLLVQKRN